MLLRPPLALGLAALAQLGLAIKSVTELFDVELQSDMYGSCRYVGEENLNKGLQECHDLATRGMELMGDYYDENRQEARRLADSFFGQLFIDRVGEIRRRYERVKTWLEVGGPVLNNRVQAKPRLFCNDDWAVKETMNSPARGSDGGLILDQSRAPVPLRNVPAMVEARQRAAGTLQTALEDVDPFWSYVHKSYWFDTSDDEDYDGNGAYGSPCSSEGIYGLISQRPQALVIVCPRGWRPEWSTTPGDGHGGGGGGGGGGNQLDWLPLWAPQMLPHPILTEQAVEELTDAHPDAPAPWPLSRQTTSASTLFHELFHLVLGAERGQTQPPDLEHEVYELMEVLELDFDNAVANPESYVYAAHAYEATRQLPPNAAGERVEFWTGVATQGRWDP